MADVFPEPLWTVKCFRKHADPEAEPECWTFYRGHFDAALATLRYCHAHLLSSGANGFVVMEAAVYAGAHIYSDTGSRYHQ